MSFIDKKHLSQKLSIAGNRLLLYVVFALVLPALLLWACVAIRYSNLPGDSLPLAVSVVYFGSVILLFAFCENLKKALAIFATSQIVIMIWMACIKPSNDREWHRDVAVMPAIEFAGDLVHVKNIRNFHYRSTSDYDTAYYDQTYDLSKIEGTDLILSHWDGLQSIAHTFMSFRFSDGKTLCVSVEVRKEKGEEYSTAKGFFRQYELIYVIGDEKDLLQLRTNHRHEETFLYPTRLHKAHSRQLLTSILTAAEELRHKPKFYNTFGQNCTTTLVDHLKELDGVTIHPNQQLLLNGVSDHFAYQKGMLDNDLPFSTLRGCAFISEAAQPFKNDPEFSKKVRAIVNERIDKIKNKRQAPDKTRKVPIS